MQDEIIPPVYDGQPGRDDFAKSPRDLKYPSNSLYYSGPSKMIETHVTKKENMKDEDWVDSVSLSPTPYSCLLYTSPSPRDRTRSRMPSSA